MVMYHYVEEGEGPPLLLSGFTVVVRRRKVGRDYVKEASRYFRVIMPTVVDMD